MRKEKKSYTEEEKRCAVDEYVSGRKTAKQAAEEIGADKSLIYKWRVEFDEEARGERLDELQAQGNSKDQARKILHLEMEMEEYKKKVAEQAIIIDLLKKLQTSKRSQPESELSGLIATVKKSGPKNGPAK
jgi:transposase-like protein